ncbi:hypothetical protein BMS3Bbin07_00867 [bacterium BMS3Bbin07]|nr:hypothetical protein BMS3Bbin07_00867 [bacterium BMS3Bbin07]
MHTLSAVNLDYMGPEFLVDPEVVSLTKQVEVVVGQKGTPCRYAAFIFLRVHSTSPPALISSCMNGGMGFA